MSRAVFPASGSAVRARFSLPLESTVCLPTPFRFTHQSFSMSGVTVEEVVDEPVAAPAPADAGDSDDDMPALESAETTAADGTEVRYQPCCAPLAVQSIALECVGACVPCPCVGCAAGVSLRRRCCRCSRCVATHEACGVSHHACQLAPPRLVAGVCVRWRHISYSDGVGAVYPCRTSRLAPSRPVARRRAARPCSASA